MKYFYADVGNQPTGPYSEDELRQLHLAGTIKPSTYVIEEGGTAWLSYTQKFGTGNTGLGVPPPPSAANNYSVNNEWLITLLLCLFLGTLGIHRFYSGHIFTGILQLVTFGGLGIWWLYDLIMIAFGKFKTKAGVVLKR
jgi:hypothetical protein